MLFNSYEFILLFLPSLLVLYFTFLKFHYYLLSRIFLVIVSALFYAYSSLENSFLLLFSVTINFLVSKLFHYNRLKKSALIFGIIFNLSLLGYYKYSNFFLENVNALLETDYTYLYITLPLAISFFTFQQIAYLIDSYNQKIKEESFLNYLLFVTFFPQLVIGPIVKHQELIPQFFRVENLKINMTNITQGTFLIAIGLFKKVVLADTLAVWANSGMLILRNLTFMNLI